MTEKKKIELKRVNMNLPSDLVDRVVLYGERLGLNTTSAYVVLLNQALEQSDVLSKLPTILQLINQANQFNQIEKNED